MTGRPCLVCLESLGPAEERYHRRCLVRLFNSSRAPAIDIDIAKLQALALAMVGHTSLAGALKAP